MRTTARSSDSDNGETKLFLRGRESSVCKKENRIMESKDWLHYPISIDLPFLSVGRLRCGYSICADLKGAGFFGIIRSKYERKIIPKTASRLNLPLSNRVRTTFVPVEERATVL